MKREEVRRNTRLGIFVITGILLFLFAIFYVGSEQSLFNANFPLRANFVDVNGLQKGNNVWLSGVKVGTVREVNIIDNSMVQIEMRIDQKLRQFIKEDALASISSEGFVGNTIVVIEPGSSPQAVADNAIIRTGQQTSTQDMMNALQTTAENITNITHELRQIMQEAGKEGTLGSLLTDTTLGPEIKLTIDNIQTTGRRSAVLTSDVIQMLTQLKNNESGVVNTLLTDTSFSRTYEETLANIKTAGEQAAAASAELTALVEKIDNQKNAMGVVLNDTAFANNIQKTADQLSEGVAKFNENMEAAQHNFLLRRYFKKKKRQEEKENN